MKKNNIAIFLGASNYPKSLYLSDGSESFKKSHDALKEIIESNICEKSHFFDLFNSTNSASDQYEQIGIFLNELLKSEHDIENLFVFYIGHGGVSNLGQEYYLTISDTRHTSPYQSSLIAKELAGLLRKNAMLLRRYIFLDSCFSAAAVSAFQGAEQSVVSEKISEIRWNAPNSPGGTAIICAASKGDAAKYLPEGTMFTLSLLKAIQHGDNRKMEYLTFEDLYDIIKFSISVDYPDDAVLPELHVPDQKMGAIHKTNLIYNRGYTDGDVKNADEKKLYNIEKQTSAHKDNPQNQHADLDNNKTAPHNPTKNEITMICIDIKNSPGFFLVKKLIMYSSILIIIAFFTRGATDIHLQSNYVKTKSEALDYSEEAKKTVSSTLILGVVPQDAVIKIQGETGGENQYIKGMQLPVGVYKITISRDGYHSITDTINVTTESSFEKSYTLDFRKYSLLTSLSNFEGLGSASTVVNIVKKELFICGPNKTGNNSANNVQVYDLTTLKLKKVIKSGNCVTLNKTDDQNWITQWQASNDYVILNTTTGETIPFKWDYEYVNLFNPVVISLQNKKFLSEMKCTNQKKISQFIAAYCEKTFTDISSIEDKSINLRITAGTAPGKMCFNEPDKKSYCIDKSGFSMTLDNKKMLKGHTWTITDISVIDSGKTVVTASRDGTIRFWDSNDGKEVSRVQWLPDTEKIYTYTDTAGNEFLLGISAYDGIKLWKREPEKA